jgi:hypothetical protein
MFSLAFDNHHSSNRCNQLALAIEAMEDVLIEKQITTVEELQGKARELRITADLQELSRQKKILEEGPGPIEKEG